MWLELATDEIFNTDALACDKRCRLLVSADGALLYILHANSDISLVNTVRHPPIALRSPSGLDRFATLSPRLQSTGNLRNTFVHENVRSSDSFALTTDFALSLDETRLFIVEHIRRLTRCLTWQLLIAAECRHASPLLHRRWTVATVAFARWISQRRAITP